MQNKYKGIPKEPDAGLQQRKNDIAEPTDGKARKKGRKGRQHLFSAEQILSFQSVRDWLSKLPEQGGGKGKSKATVDAYVWAMQVYTDALGKNPDQFITERNTEMGSLDLLVRTTAERALDRFVASYHSKSVAALIARAIQSFYKKHRMALQSISVPSDDAIVVRLRDRIPTDHEVRLMCDNCDMRDRLLLLVEAQVGMRVGSLVLLQYRHVKEDLEEKLIPNKVIVPLYEREYHRLGSVTFICGDAVALLKQYLDARRTRGETITDESWIFPRHEGRLDHISEAGVWKVLRREARRVGLIRPDEGGLTEFRFHCFRKRFKTVLEGTGAPLAWVDLMMCHLPRGAEGQAYTRPHEDELREWYEKAVPRLLVYGRPPDLATVDDVEKKVALKFYWLSIENSPVAEQKPEEVLGEDGKKQPIEEQIGRLKE